MNDAETIANLRANLANIQLNAARDSDAIMQVLAAALHLPRFCDDQEHFPGATEANGYFTGEDVPATMAEQAARRIAELEAKLDGERLARRDQEAWPPGTHYADAIGTYVDSLLSDLSAACKTIKKVGCFLERMGVDRANGRSDEDNFSGAICAAYEWFDRGKREAEGGATG